MRDNWGRVSLGFCDFGFGRLKVAKEKKKKKLWLSVSTKLNFGCTGARQEVGQAGLNEKKSGGQEAPHLLEGRRPEYPKNLEETPLALGWAVCINNDVAGRRGNRVRIGCGPGAG